MMLRRLVMLAAMLVVLVLPMTALAIDGPTTANEPPVDAPIAEATDEARAMRRELRDLADAWSEGGGRFGYPFWEKAGQRWRDGQLTTTMYREYVTGYRDRLRSGCELLDGADVETSTAQDVRELALDACRSRVDALRDQQRWLDELIARDIAEGDPEVDIEAIDDRIAERETAWREQLQESLRDARLATELAQAELDAAGLERISEGAFL